MQVMKKCLFFALLLASAVSLLVPSARSACTPRPGPGEIKLTQAEVRAIFIGKPWHGPSGAFIFKEEGTYSYKPFTSSSPYGTWAYQLLEDGTIQGGSTTYAFYRSGSSYRYFHGRECQFNWAIPNRAF